MIPIPIQTQCQVQLYDAALHIDDVLDVVVESGDHAGNQPCMINYQKAIPPTLSNPGEGVSFGGFNVNQIAITPITVDWQAGLVFGGQVTGGSGPGTPASTDLSIISLGKERVKVYCSNYTAQFLQVQLLENIGVWNGVGRVVNVGRGQDVYPNSYQPSRIEPITFSGESVKQLHYFYDSPQIEIIQQTKFFSITSSLVGGVSTEHFLQASPPTYDPSTGRFTTSQAVYGSLVVRYAPCYSIFDIFYGTGIAGMSTDMIASIKMAWLMGNIDDAKILPVSFLVVSDRAAVTASFPRSIWPKGAPPVQENKNLQEVGRKSIKRRMYADGTSVHIVDGVATADISASGAAKVMDVADSVSISYQDSAGGIGVTAFQIPPANNPNYTNGSGTVDITLTGSIFDSINGNIAVTGTMQGTLYGGVGMEGSRGNSGNPQLTGNLSGGISGQMTLATAPDFGIGIHFGGSFYGSLSGSFQDDNTPPNAGSFGGSIVGSVSGGGQLDAIIQWGISGNSPTKDLGSLNGNGQGSFVGQITNSTSINLAGSMSGSMSASQLT